MPFDATPILRPAVSRSGVEIGKLRLLSEALKREMPEGFEWEFGNIFESNECGTVVCAAGLAYSMGLLARKPWCNWAMDGFREERLFGLSAGETYAVFGSVLAYGVDWDDVTPAMVAAAIDAILSREEADTL